MRNDSRVAAVAGVLVVVLDALSLCAQSAPAGADMPSFEVASIKPNTSGSPLLMMVPQPGGRFTATNVSLRMLIQNAYQLPPFRIEGGPSWIGSDRFDVAARAEGNPPQEQIRLMLRKLLAERFELSVHSETRELPVFNLVTSRRDGKPGPQLRRSEVDCDAVLASLPDPPPPDGSPLCGYIGPAPGTRFSSGRANMAIRGLTMDRFARFLVQVVRRSVIDRTGLDGYFDGDFDVTAEFPPPPPPPGIPDPFDRSSFPTIFTVLPEQLGLKLESARGPVDVLVIDRAERPAED